LSNDCNTPVAPGGRQRTSGRKKSPAQGGPARGSSALGLGGKISALDIQNATGAGLFRVLPKYLLNPGSFTHCEVYAVNGYLTGDANPEGRASKMRRIVSPAAFRSRNRNLRVPSLKT
jgi:hypothetical protein